MILGNKSDLQLLNEFYKGEAYNDTYLPNLRENLCPYPKPAN